jgi:hypothetical protein
MRIPATKAEGRAVAQAGGGPAGRKDRWRRVVAAAEDRPARGAAAKRGTAAAALPDRAFPPDKFLKQPPINLSCRKWSGEVLHKLSTDRFKYGIQSCKDPLFLNFFIHIDEWTTGGQQCGFSRNTTKIV